MRIQVKLLASYRRYLPPDAEGAIYRLDLPPGTDIEALLERLPLPADEDRVVLVNGRTARPGHVLEEGDTVAVFPAMAGG